MVARLTQTPIATHNSSTNATLDDDPITFPLNHNLYVDATHEVVVLNSAFRLTFTSYFPCTRKGIDLCFGIVITALNLSSFAAAGPLPSDHIPSYRTFRSSQLSPFSTNIQFQRAYSLALNSSLPRPILLQKKSTLTSTTTKYFPFLAHSALLRNLSRSPNPRYHQRRRRPSYRHRRLPGGQTRHVSHPDVC